MYECCFRCGGQILHHIVWLEHCLLSVASSSCTAYSLWFEIVPQLRVVSMMCSSLVQSRSFHWCFNHSLWGSSTGWKLLIMVRPFYKIVYFMQIWPSLWWKLFFFRKKTIVWTRPCRRTPTQVWQILTWSVVACNAAGWNGRAFLPVATCYAANC